MSYTQFNFPIKEKFTESSPTIDELKLYLKKFKYIDPNEIPTKIKIVDVKDKEAVAGAFFRMLNGSLADNNKVETLIFREKDILFDKYEDFMLNEDMHVCDLTLNNIEDNIRQIYFQKYKLQDPDTPLLVQLSNGYEKEDPRVALILIKAIQLFYARFALDDDDY